MLRRMETIARCYPVKQYRPPIPKAKPLVRTFAGTVVRPQLKRADALYLTYAYEVWRKAVVFRAGHRCQAMDGGRRCSKAAPQHRMFADHIVELQDGGAPFDPANGQCLCGAHHTAKTVMVRALRLGT
jgi:hypothetical protein